MNVSADQLAASLMGARPPKPRCRACPEILDPMLVDREDNTGLHIGCSEPGTQVDEVNDFLMGGVTPLAPAADKIETAKLKAAGCCGGWIGPGGEQVRCDPCPLAPTPATPRLEVPPSTVGELHQVLIDYDASRPRSMQTRLGPSELGTPCDQQIARKLAGAPRRPVTSPTWAPFQGTAVHAEMEKVVAFWNERLGRVRWLAEDDLVIDDEIAGHGDAYDLDFDEVVDWKHVGTTALDKLRAARRAGKTPAEQVSPEYRVQAHLYGVGHERKGRPVKWVRLVLLARSWQFEDSDEWTEAYQPEIAFAALTRYYAIQDLLRAFDVANNPDLITLVQATPSSDSCKWCPFHRPGRPSNFGGCEGNRAANERRVGRFTDGLIAP